jgi:hypothetical protein
VTQVFTPSKRLRLKPHFEIDWKILKGGITPEAVPMDELPTVIQEVNANLQKHVLQSLNPGNEYHISFDQLDLGFDPNLPDYNNRLIGLLLACRDINLAARTAGKKLFVSVLLRDDIYDSLQFEDKNKLTENFASTIEWDTPRTSHTLRQLMEKRFDVVLGSRRKESISWEHVFDEEREMPGRQSKYRHITDRTYLRPRDIIKFCNTILKQYKARRAADPKSEPEQFDNADIHAARPEYSDYLLRELDDEIHKHIPDYQNLLALLSSLGVWQFDRPRFEEICAARADLVGRREPLSILQDLYTFSIIGFYRSGGKGLGGSEYVFRYREPRAPFDTTAQRFRVHSGLIDALGLKRFEGTGADESSEG